MISTPTDTQLHPRWCGSVLCFDLGFARIDFLFDKTVKGNTQPTSGDYCGVLWPIFLWGGAAEWDADGSKEDTL